MSALASYGNPQFGNSVVTNNGFEILADCKFFHPEKISVRVNNNLISITGEHEERQPGYPMKYIRRKLDQCFTIPPSYNLARLVSGLSPEGILSIRCP